MGTICVISSTLALIFIKHGFIEVFAITTIIQLLVYWSSLPFIHLYSRKLQIRELETLEKQGMEISCPCFKKNKQFIPIILNTDNTFDCNVCNKQINVEVDVTSILATIPVDINQSNKNINEIYNSLITTRDSTDEDKTTPTPTHTKPDAA